MPAEQTGSVIQRGKGWAVRYRDHENQPRRKGGFASKREARKWLDGQLDTVEKNRARIARGESIEEPVAMLTVRQLVDKLIDGHTGASGTKATLRHRLRYLVDEFGDKAVDRVRFLALHEWYGSDAIPAGSRWGVGKAVRQAFSFAVSAGLIEESPAAGLVLGAMPKADVETLTRTEVDLIDAELPRHLRGLVIFAAETGLRPEELTGLDVADVDRQARTVTVRRRYVGGELLPGLKTSRRTGKTERVVPLTSRALAALDARKPQRLSPILFPGKRGGRLDWHHFRGHVWTPTIEGLDGVEHRTPYSLRHTFISNALAAGVPTIEVAEVAGTSMAMIEHTYGHVTTGARDRLVAALEAAAL
jgi:integrase